MCMVSTRPWSSVTQAESLDYSYIKLKGFGQAGRFGHFDAELRDTVMMYEGSSVESEDEE